ncbi:MAG: phosphatidylserine decarboxylase [Candidatus Coatesbacteria bacterium]
MGLARASFQYLAVALAASVLAGVVWRWTGHPAAAAALGFALLVTAAIAWFFRDPERAIRRDPNLVLCPADGVVMALHREGPTQTIEIFMAVYNVHVQRVPMDGRVVSRTYTKGTYLVASDPVAGTRNTRCATELATKRGRIGILQVSGAIARKVECWIAPGQTVTQGGRMGIIHFGSQVRLRLPRAAKLLVRPGQRVTAGVTVVAKWR